MSSKVFLSFLGTNDYIPCYYYDELEEGQKSTLSKYVQTALLELYAKDFSENDKCYFFLTEEAEQRNWISDSQYNKDTGEYDKENKGLKECLDELKLRNEVIPKRIPEGFSSEQVWKIFEIVRQSVEGGDEVYLDITHAFRSIPMLGMSLLNYLKIVKNIKVKGIFYGAFEKLGRIPQVLKMKEEDRLAPIINLLTFSELQDWTLATNSFVKYGKTDQLNEIAEEPLNELARNFKGQEENFNKLRYVFTRLNIFSDLIETNRGPELKEFDFTGLKEQIDQIITSKNIYLPAYQANLESIRKRIEDFNVQNSLNFLRLVTWTRDNGMLQQAITQLKEGITTYFAQKYNLSIEDESVRNNIDRALYSLGDEKRSSENYLFGNPLSQDEEAIALSKGFRNFSGDVRNDINHNGMRKGASNAKNLKKKFDDFFLLVQEQLKERTAAEEVSSPMLLNLSNHPSASWSESQLSSAIKQYQSVEDLPFPKIDPSWSADQVEQLAEEFEMKIRKINPSAVHLMGEMTFTFKLVNRLQRIGIPCIASTTERVATEDENGNKTSIFKFVRFRNY